MTPKEVEAKVEECFAHATNFAAKFPGLHVPCTRFGGAAPGAMAAHHNKDTGWGFTAQFQVTPDGVIHLHAWAEIVTKDDQLEGVAAEFAKIVNAPNSDPG